MHGLRLDVGEFDAQTLAHLLVVLVEHNIRLLRRSNMPPLYGAGVTYRREPVGSEHWRSADLVLQDGHGDCEDLAAWRAAEIAVRHPDATDIAAILRRMYAAQYHVVVRYTWRGRQHEEDPSVALGMPAATAHVGRWAPGAAP